jgi:hypothetical protein
MTGQLFPTLTPAQLELVQAPLAGHTFLEGPAGCGKTTVGVERLVHLLENGVPGESILVFVPQRALGAPYYGALRTPGLVAGGMSDVLTIGGLARRMVELFWPLVAGPAGFVKPDLPPTFLTLETAQYYMAHLVRPLLEQGYFDTVVIERNRLYSQILDNLNKAAMVGFSHTAIGERLKSAWVGELAQLMVYENAQDCANLFRSYCLEHNLLDFSLQIEIFNRLLWPQRWFQAHLAARYRHLIADNLEENPPVAHDLLRKWLADFDSALLIFDNDAGYRFFLGADPDDAFTLREACQRQGILDKTFVSPPEVAALGQSIDHQLRPIESRSQSEPVAQVEDPTLVDPSLALEFTFTRYYPEMLDWVADQIQRLVNEQGTPPGEIVVLAPFLSDALRFSLTYRLETRGVPVRAYRPSRALRDEPATRCLLTLAALAHPDWGVSPPPSDFANTLLQSIAGLDLVRARLLAEIVYRNQSGEPVLSPFERITPEMQERITFSIGERYEILRRWVQDYTESQPEALDHFLARLFGEVLSQPGFGFHADFKAGEVTANLIESVQKFRWVAAEPLESAGIPLGREYLEMVQDGVIAAAYVESMQEQPEQAVFLAPAYTFLMQNRPVEYQFWLDAGNRSWFERIDQPLTHPYVLSRRWPRRAIWTQTNEDETSRDTLGRLALGLARRCRGRIYLGLSRLSEQGFESRGPLLRAIDRVLRTAPPLDSEAGT